MFHLILTLDYEVFGNGSGDVKRDVIDPTMRILEICDRYSAKLTIMFEVAEYLCFLRAEEDGKMRLPYSASESMRLQAQEAIRAGHDVQLHFHPQWIGAELIDGIWKVKNRQWRISDLPCSSDFITSLPSIKSVLRHGKDTLEDMLQPIDPLYRCIAFRAGAFLAQPAEPLIEGMKSAGLMADTSVVRGLKREIPWQVDYSKAPSSTGCWWTSKDDLCSIGNIGQNILEFPVFSLWQPYIYNFKPRKLYATLKRRNIELKDQNSDRLNGSRLNLNGLFRNLFSFHPHNVDFCKLNDRDLSKAVINLIDRTGNNINGPTPLTLIGHSKDFWNDKNFDLFLGRMARFIELGAPLTFKTLSSSIAEVNVHNAI